MSDHDAGNALLFGNAILEGSLVASLPDSVCVSKLPIDASCSVHVGESGCLHISEERLAAGVEADVRNSPRGPETRVRAVLKAIFGEIEVTRE